jgi:hypothetical protein
MLIAVKVFGGAGGCRIVTTAREGTSLGFGRGE